MEAVAPFEGGEPVVFTPRRTKKSPATQMREMLSASRRYGIDFDRAWDSAFDRIRWPHDTGHRLDWKAELESEKEIWRSCYERRGKANRSLVAVYTLLASTERALSDAA